MSASLKRGGARKGAGRPRSIHDAVAVNRCISRVSADWLKKLAFDRGVSESAALEHLILSVEKLPDQLLTGRR